jgi:hypothetical protein
MGVFDDSSDQQQHLTSVEYAPRDRQQLWKAAIKVPMYSVGVVPVLVSARLAYSWSGLQQHMTAAAH